MTMNAKETELIPLDRIERDGLNARQTGISMDDEDLKDLARSIGEVGLMQPIVVRPKGNGKYSVVVGQRRFMAHQLLKKDSIWAIVRDDLDEVSAKILSISENLHRKPLNHEDILNAVSSLYSTHFNNDDKALSKALGLSLQATRFYIKVDLVATQGMKDLLIKNEVSKADVKKALDASGGDTPKAEKILRAMVEMNPEEKRLLKEVARSDPERSAEDLVRDAKKPRLRETIYFSVSTKLLGGIKKAEAAMNLDRSSLIQEALEDWLFKNNITY